MLPTRLHRYHALGLLLAATLVAPVGAATTSPSPGDRAPHPVVTAAARTQEPHSVPGMRALGFMAGCWTSEPDGNGIVIEEIYTEPADNLILGLSRYLRGNTAVTHEFTRIAPGNPHQRPAASEDGSIFLHPYPGGNPSEAAFRLTEVGDDRAVFEAPEHDFPRRVIYTRTDEDTLVARIDDGSDEGRSMSWTMTAAACPGSD